MNTKKCPNGHRMKKMYRVLGGQLEWYCETCGATAPLRGTPPKAPNASFFLDPDLLAWLKRHGGIQPTIRKWATAARDGRLVIVEEEVK